MRTDQLKIDAEHPQPLLIARAANIIQRGGLVAFPTETVYGLGANAMDASALAKIYSAKQRPATDPIIAHIYDTAQLKSLAVDVPPIAYTLAAHFWPGALTLILKRAPGVPQEIAKGMNTVAVRMPAHPVAAALLKAANTPIGAPSANTFTRPSATTAAHVLEDLDGRIDMLLDGGSTQIGLESTVLDLTSAVPTILRPGGVLADDLRELIPQLNVSTRYLDADAASVAPGQMRKHYSPRARVMLFSGASGSSVQEQMRLTAQTLIHSGQHVGALLADEDIEGFAAGTVAAALGSRHDMPAISRRLFAALRELDSRGVDVILVNDPGREGLGAALWDRLVRAAEGEVINVLR